MFSILKREDKEQIAEIYHLDADVLANYLVILSNYRNLCAHEDILYENKTQKVIGDTLYHSLLHIPKLDDEYIYGKNDLFALIIIMKHMLTAEEFQNMSLEIDHIIDNLAYNLHTISVGKILDKMGFPENWMELASFQNEKEEL